jgi:hypothetical protein
LNYLFHISSKTINCYFCYLLNNFSTNLSVVFSATLSDCTPFSVRLPFSTTLSPLTPNGEAAWRQRRLPLPFKRGTNVQLRTTVPAGFLPPLRQTACCVFVHFPRVLSLSFPLHYRAVFSFQVGYFSGFIVGLYSLFKSVSVSTSLSCCTLYSSRVTFQDGGVHAGDKCSNLHNCFCGTTAPLAPNRSLYVRAFSESVVFVGFTTVLCPSRVTFPLHCQAVLYFWYTAFSQFRLGQFLICVSLCV